MLLYNLSTPSPPSRLPSRTLCSIFSLILGLDDTYVCQVIMRTCPPPLHALSVVVHAVDTIWTHLYTPPDVYANMRKCVSECVATFVTIDTLQGLGATSSTSLVSTFLHEGTFSISQHITLALLLTLYYMYTHARRLKISW